MVNAPEPVLWYTTPDSVVVLKPLLATDILVPEGLVTIVDGNLNLYGLVKDKLPTPFVNVTTCVIFHGLGIVTLTGPVTKLLAGLLKTCAAFSPYVASCCKLFVFVLTEVQLICIHHYNYHKHQTLLILIMLKVLSF